MSFHLGASANPVGRPKGARNRQTQEIVDLIKASGDKDSLEVLSEIVSTSANPEHRISASNILGPYLHSKRGTAVAPRFIDTPVVVPAFTSIEQGEDYLASLPVLLGKGELDSQTALELSTLTRNWLSAICERQEYGLKLQALGAHGDAIIRIEGGLPPLPGTNITMPAKWVTVSKNSRPLRSNNRRQTPSNNKKPQMPIKEVRSPTSSPSVAHDPRTCYPPGARSNPGRVDQSRSELPASPSHTHVWLHPGDNQPAELTITGPQPERPHGPVDTH
jgi:hypothetical protein